MPQLNQLIHYSVIVRSIRTGDTYEKWWDEELLDRLGTELEEFCHSFVIGTEIGSINRQIHLQCYIRLKAKQRQSPLIKRLLQIISPPTPDLVQVQPAKHARQLSEYCKKSKDFITEKHFRITLYEKELKGLVLNSFQNKILNALDTCNDRQIAIASCRVGNSGKTTLLKYLAITRKTIIWPQAGSFSSCLYAVGRQLSSVDNDNELVTILINMPRNDSRMTTDERKAEFISGIESLKDGFFSTSFMGKLVSLNVDPNKIRILVVTNHEPTEFCKYLSQDRIKLITN